LSYRGIHPLSILGRAVPLKWTRPAERRRGDQIVLGTRTDGRMEGRRRPRRSHTDPAFDAARPGSPVSLCVPFRAVRWPSRGCPRSTH